MRAKMAADRKKAMSGANTNANATASAVVIDIVAPPAVSIFYHFFNKTKT